MSGYNEVKRELLALLYDVGKLTSKEAAELLGWGHESAAMALLRYHRQGLVSRYTLTGKTRVYELTNRGLERLEYLQSLRV